jgi:hypothetical protein
MQRVRLPDGRVVEFPPDWTKEQIKAHIEERTSAPKPPKAGEEGFEHDFDAMNMAANIIPSAVNLGKDVLSAAMNPIDTAKGIGALGGSVLAKGQRKVRELASGTEIEPGEDEAIADAVWEAAVGRYGGIEELQRTLENDPVGLLSDFSGALGAASKLGKSSKLGQVASVVDPVNAPIILAKQAAKHGISTDKMLGMYQSAAKFPTTMRNRDKVTQTALDYGVTPSKGGLKKVDKAIAKNEMALGAIIDEATKTGQKIPVEKVFQHMEGLYDSMGGFKAEGFKDQAAVLRVMDDAQETLMGRTHISPRELQDFKTDLYYKVYQRRKSPEPKRREGAKTQAQQQLARGAKDVISEAVPGTTDLNRTLSDLYTIQAPVGRSAARIENTNKIPARAMFGGAAAGGAAAGNPKVAAALAATAWIMDNPQLKSRMAIAINNAKKGNIGAVEKGLRNTREIRAALALAERSEEELRELGLLE